MLKENENLLLKKSDEKWKLFVKKKFHSDRDENE